MSNDIRQLFADLEAYINERVAQHQENLRLWENGFLTPTEPDPDERRRIKAELHACISELERLRTHLIQSPFARRWDGKA